MANNPTTLINAALAQAQAAAAAHEVSVGAVLADASGTVLAAAHNTVEAEKNPLAHAEMRVLNHAIAAGVNLQECTLAVTLEPCAMCMAAICAARVGTVVFGAYDVKSGGTVNGARVPSHSHFKPQILGGIEEDACRELLQAFFKTLRQ